MLKRIEHVQLAMPPGREDHARAFYRDLLGVPEVPKPPQLAARGGVWFERGALKIHLGVDADFAPARKAHPAFLVEGLEALAARLRAAGCEIEDEPLKGYRRIYVADPFRNRIELMEPVGPPIALSRSAGMDREERSMGGDPPQSGGEGEGQ